MTPEQETQLLQAVDDLRIAVDGLTINLAIYIPVLQHLDSMKDIRKYIDSTQAIITKLKEEIKV